jgi:hypothetical protein
MDAKSSGGCLLTNGFGVEGMMNQYGNLIKISHKGMKLEAFTWILETNFGLMDKHYTVTACGGCALDVWQATLTLPQKSLFTALSSLDWKKSSPIYLSPPKFFQEYSVPTHKLLDDDELILEALRRKITETEQFQARINNEVIIE